MEFDGDLLSVAHNPLDPASMRDISDFFTSSSESDRHNDSLMRDESFRLMNDDTIEQRAQDAFVMETNAVLNNSASNEGRPLEVDGKKSEKLEAIELESKVNGIETNVAGGKQRAVVKFKKMRKRKWLDERTTLTLEELRFDPQSEGHSITPKIDRQLVRNWLFSFRNVMGKMQLSDVNLTTQLTSPPAKKSRKSRVHEMESVAGGGASGRGDINLDDSPDVVRARAESIGNPSTFSSNNNSDRLSGSAPYLQPTPVKNQFSLDQPLIDQPLLLAEMRDASDITLLDDANYGSQLGFQMNTDTTQHDEQRMTLLSLIRSAGGEVTFSVLTRNQGKKYAADMFFQVLGKHLTALQIHNFLLIICNAIILNSLEWNVHCPTLRPFSFAFLLIVRSDVYAEPGPSAPESHRRTN